MFPIDQVVIDGNRVISPINITPAQADKFCNAATRSQQDGKQNTPKVMLLFRDDTKDKRWMQDYPDDERCPQGT